LDLEVKNILLRIQFQDGIEGVDLSDYYTKDEVNTALEKITVNGGEIDGSK
jgi:hypothetical protein